MAIIVVSLVGMVAAISPPVSLVRVLMIILGVVVVVMTTVSLAAIGIISSVHMFIPDTDGT